MSKIEIVKNWYLTFSEKLEARDKTNPLTKMILTVDRGIVLKQLTEEHARKIAGSIINSSPGIVLWYRLEIFDKAVHEYLNKRSN